MFLVPPILAPKFRTPRRPQNDRLRESLETLASSFSKTVFRERKGVRRQQKNEEKGKKENEEKREEINIPNKFPLLMRSPGNAQGPIAVPSRHQPVTTDRFRLLRRVPLPLPGHGIPENTTEIPLTSPAKLPLPVFHQHGSDSPREIPRAGFLAPTTPPS